MGGLETEVGEDDITPAGPNQASLSLDPALPGGREERETFMLLGWAWSKPDLLSTSPTVLSSEASGSPCE